MDVASTSYSSSNAKRSRKNVEMVNDSDDEVASNVKLDLKYVKEHLYCLTFLCKKFVEYDKDDLTFTLENDCKTVWKFFEINWSWCGCKFHTF